jgi:hypothetical protein
VTKEQKNPVLSDAIHKSPSNLPRSCPTFWDVIGHHAITTVLGIEAEVDDLERHHQGDTTVQSIKEPEDPELPTKHMTTKTMKRRWGHHALPIGFASRQYPKVSNYPMISKI